MKKFFLILVLAAGAMSLRAQEIVVPQGYQLVDSVVVRQTAQMDTTLMGKNIFSLLNSGKGTVTVAQPDKVRDGMSKHIDNNKKEKISGYRVRIYFDNKQNSRGASEEAQRRFQASHPGIMAYRSFTNPFFKVTVGDFRTRSEAIQLMQQISREFPTAFIVKETINYPVVDKKDSYIVDTLHIVRPITPELSNL